MGYLYIYIIYIYIYIYTYIYIYIYIHIYIYHIIWYLLHLNSSALWQFRGTVVWALCVTVAVLLPSPQKVRPGYLRYKGSVVYIYLLNIFLSFKKLLKYIFAPANPCFFSLIFAKKIWLFFSVSSMQSKCSFCNSDLSSW